MWGLETLIDLKECSPEKIRDKVIIQRYIDEVIELIDMKKFGTASIIHFGSKKEVMGYTFMQLIETSLISGHCIEHSNSACINIFSCKIYDPMVASNFTASFFDAKKFSYVVEGRG